MKKLIAVVLALVFTAGRVQADFSSSPGDWGENSLPHITTEKDYIRYQKAAKTVRRASIVGFLVAGGLLAYSRKLDRRAHQPVAHEGPILDPMTGVVIYEQGPAIPSSLSFHARLQDRANGAKTAAIGLAVLSAFGIGLSFSLTF